MQFIIELDENNLVPTSEVGLNIIEYCRFLNWINRDKEYIAYFGLIGRDRVYKCMRDAALDHRINKDMLDYSKICPVGSVDFTNYILGKSGKKIKPINIPDELSDYEFIHRDIARGTYDTVADMLSKHDSVFIKPELNAKEFEPSIVNKTNFNINDCKNTYFISEVINLETEWRLLIRNKSVIHSTIYNGDIHNNIDWNFVSKCINSYKNSPNSYALDIGKTTKENFVVVEVNNFIACGTYGYSDENLVRMVIDGWKYEMAQ